MDCQQLFGEFLSEYPEYDACIECHDDVPVINWSGLRVFLLWLRRDHYISDTVFSRGDEFLHDLEARRNAPRGMSSSLTSERAN